MESTVSHAYRNLYKKTKPLPWRAPYRDTVDSSARVLQVCDSRSCPEDILHLVTVVLLRMTKLAPQFRIVLLVKGQVMVTCYYHLQVFGEQKQKMGKVSAILSRTYAGKLTCFQALVLGLKSAINPRSGTIDNNSRNHGQSK